MSGQTQTKTGPKGKGSDDPGVVVLRERKLDKQSGGGDSGVTVLPEKRLDESVSELLELLEVGDGGNEGQQTVAKQTAPLQQPQKPGELYQAALLKAQPAVENARKIAVIFAKADPARKAMDDALLEAVQADTKKDFKTAQLCLEKALAQAKIVGDAIRNDYIQRKTVIEQPLAEIERRIGALNAPAAGVTQALQTAKTAQTNAKPADDDKPGDWTNANNALSTFKSNIEAIGPACVVAAQAKGAAFDLRFNPVKNNKPAGSDFVKKLTAYLAARKPVDAAIAGSDGLTALEKVPAADLALTAFVNAAAPNDQVKQQRATTALSTVTKLKDKDLEKKSLLEKAELAFDLCANGTPTTKDGLKQLCRLYSKSKPDPEFMKKRAQQREAIVDEILTIPEVKGVFDKKGAVDSKAWKQFIKDADKVEAMLTKICDKQCDTLGMPRIPVRQNPKPPKGRTNGVLTFGGYNPASNSIRLKMHPDCLKTVKDGFDTIIHETFHAHQDFIVKKLKSGDIGPDDPDFSTAMMYMVNDIGIGYVQSSDDGVGQKNYEMQPTEFDSFHHAGETIKAALIKAKKNAKAK